MPILNLLGRPTLPKTWEELAPAVAEAETTVPLPKFTFDPADTAPNVITDLLPDPIPYLRRASAFTLAYLESAKDPPEPAVLLKLSMKEGIAVTSGGEMTLFVPYFAQHGKTHTKDETLHEILGVILHELVHVYQHDGHGTVPGGLIEGVADFIRLRAKLGPPHWNRSRGGKWDAGYERTAYFLDWVEGSHHHFVRDLNAESKDAYELGVFKTLTGQNVEELWEAYQQSLPSPVDGSAAPALPTEAAAPGAWPE
ncbi:BSP-domain-containing protein [Calocera viscosa TUFC12733]|uniref:BSP-domain-containing protein n=1 Tax=Calocera viscosa (strain TUFC12733) TaxID=1330018 RepID=A0A167MAT3_CALVF|nr:BSP-domain-containing protein [Calocera viscosa TUFC12733]